VLLIQSLPYPRRAGLARQRSRVAGGWIGEAALPHPQPSNLPRHRHCFNWFHSRDELVIARPGLADDEALLEERA